MFDSPPLLTYIVVRRCSDIAFDEAVEQYRRWRKEDYVPSKENDTPNTKGVSDWETTKISGPRTKTTYKLHGAMQKAVRHMNKRMSNRTP